MDCGFKKRNLRFRGSAAFLLLPDLIQDAGKAGDRSQESTENLSNQSVLAGQFAEAVQLSGGQHGTLDNATLNGQSLQLVLLLLQS